MIKRLKGSKLVTFEVVVGLVIISNFVLNLVYYLHHW